MAEPLTRLLIVDDELPARALLRAICTVQAVTVVGEADTGEAAVDLAKQLQPDLVLLDISMPGIGGVAAARLIAGLSQPPAIVFTTAFEGHAVAAFDVGAVDYLLKPIVDERFAVMLERVRHLRRATSVAPAEDYIWVPTRSQLKRISLGDVERVNAEGDYVTIQLHGQSYLLRATMEVMAAKLHPRHFLRIHRSTIVRTNLITDLRNDGGGAWSAMLLHGETMRIGRSYLDSVRHALSTAG